MWLLIDIGNSSTKICAYNPRSSGYDIVTIPTGAAEESTLLDGFLGVEVFERAAVSSVVPQRLERYMGVLDERGIASLPVTAEIEFPFEVGYRTPATLGADRLAGAAGAVSHVRAGFTGQRNVVSVDAGTAVTFDIVSKEGVFLGGPIAAGPELLRRALSKETAQLPDVDLFMPADVISGSSEDAVRAGIMVGFVEGTLGILRQITEQLEGDTATVFSGGWGQLLANEVGPDALYRPTNIFDGLVELLKMNVVAER